MPLQSLTRNLQIQFKFIVKILFFLSKENVKKLNKIIISSIFGLNLKKNDYEKINAHSNNFINYWYF